MLRITVHHDPGLLTFQFEGKLVGPWVPEAEACWKQNLTGHRSPVVRIDLRGVTLIDTSGKSFLAAVHQRGGQFVASGCLMNAIVADIIRSPAPDRGTPSEVGSRRLNRGPT
jgi:anti-anti-sigma regulatory factor